MPRKFCALWVRVDHGAADFVITLPVFASITTSVGMPLTSNMLSSSSLRSSPCGSAFQGISPKYSSNSFSDESELAKTISHFFPAAFIFSYDSASFGVKPRHGGHQWAEK